MLTPDRVSINTATLGYRTGIEETIETVARHGFGAIAPWRREVEGNDVRAIARRIRDAGLSISGYCRSSYFPAASAEGRRRCMEENRQAIRDAATLGAPCFVLVVGGLPEGSRDLHDARAQVSDGIAALMPAASEHGVSLAIEPLHPMYAADRSCVNTLDQAREICEALDPAGTTLNIAVDAYHTWWDPNLSAAIKRAGKKISAFHICDWLVPTSDLLMDRGMMGEGVIDLSGLRLAVESSGYRGFSEVEIFSHRWWEEPAEDVLDAVRLSLLHC